MKKIPLGTKIIVTTAGLVAVAGIFYAANPQPFATIRAPMSDREIAPAEPAALRQRINELDCRLLAIEAGGAALRDLVERYACDILIVR